MSVRPTRRNLVVILDVNLQLAAAPFSGCAQPDLHPRIADQILCLRRLLALLDLDRVEDKSVRRSASAARHSHPLQRYLRRRGRGDAAEHDVCPRILAIDVLLQLHPDARQHIGTVVGVRDHLRRTKLLVLRIERRVQLIVRLVLPVLGPRRPIARTVCIHRIRQAQRSKREPRVIIAHAAQG